MVPDGGIRRGRPPMMGSSRTGGVQPAVQPNPSSAPRPRAAQPPIVASKTGKQRILFLCIGNSCRSQMAEGFAKTYGSDVLEIHSAGLAPATGIAPLTKYVMALRNVRIDETHFPKGLEMVLHQPFDIIVNMSGQPVNLPAGRMLDWPVRDPIGEQESVYRDVAAQIEDLVMRLILEVRG